MLQGGCLRLTLCTESRIRTASQKRAGGGISGLAMTDHIHGLHGRMLRRWPRSAVGHSSLNHGTFKPKQAGAKRLHMGILSGGERVALRCGQSFKAPAMSRLDPLIAPLAARRLIAGRPGMSWLLLELAPVFLWINLTGAQIIGPGAFYLNEYCQLNGFSTADLAWIPLAYAIGTLLAMAWNLRRVPSANARTRCLAACWSGRSLWLLLPVLPGCYRLASCCGGHDRGHRRDANRFSRQHERLGDMDPSRGAASSATGILRLATREHAAAGFAADIFHSNEVGNGGRDVRPAAVVSAAFSGGRRDLPPRHLGAAMVPTHASAGRTPTYQHPVVTRGAHARYRPAGVLLVVYFLHRWHDYRGGFPGITKIRGITEPSIYPLISGYACR